MVGKLTRLNMKYCSREGSRSEILVAMFELERSRYLFSDKIILSCHWITWSPLTPTIPPTNPKIPNFITV